MTEMAGTELVQADQPELPVPLWEGPAALFAAPDGGRVIRYEADGAERFIAIPRELVPSLQMLAENPGALMAISQGPMGGLARRMTGQFLKRAGLPT
jgi:hypothetical protein